MDDFLIIYSAIGRTVLKFGGEIWSCNGFFGARDEWQREMGFMEIEFVRDRLCLNILYSGDQQP